MPDYNSSRLLVLNNVLVFFSVAVFAIILILAFMEDLSYFLRIAIVCAISFVVCSCLRKIIDAPRPTYNASIYSKKSGESFPSRHVFSMAMIGFSCMLFNLWAGVAIVVLSFVLGFVRVKIGAHRTVDIVGGVVLAGICALLGYVIF